MFTKIAKSADDIPRMTVTVMILITNNAAAADYDDDDHHHHNNNNKNCVLLSSLPCHPERGRPGFDSCFRIGSFSGSNHSSDLQNGNSVATLRGAWRYRI